MARTNYYEGLAADYSRPGLVSEELKAKLIQRSAEIGVCRSQRSQQLVLITPLSRSRQKIVNFGRHHCEALRQGRGDLLTKEYRPDLVYHCQDGPYHGITEQQKREKHWWAIIAQPNVTMVWPIVQFWGEFTHFEWICLDDNTHEQIAKGSVCWVRRGHRGGCYYKSEQLTFVRDVFASEDLLKLISV